MITIRCQCGETYHADEQHLGRYIPCKCGKLLQVTAVLQHPDAGSTCDATPSAPPPQHKENARSWSIPTARNRVKQAVVLLAVVFVAASMMWRLIQNDHPSQNGGATAFLSEKRPAPSYPDPPTCNGQTGIPASVSSVKPVSIPNTASDLPPCPSEAIVRPMSGAELGGKYRGGLGRLTVINGTQYDAVSVLLDGDFGIPLRAIFIRSGESGAMTKVPVGSYKVYFQLGTDWLRERRFCQPKGTSEYDEFFDFQELELPGGTEYSVIKVTLNPVLGGTAKTHAVPDSKFILPPPVGDEKCKGTIIEKTEHITERDYQSFTNRLRNGPALSRADTLSG